MRARRLAGLIAAALLVLPTAALAAPATPDGGFGVDGVVVTDVAGRPSTAAAMLLDSAARPVVVARTGANDVGFLRRLPNGAAELASSTALGGALEFTDAAEQPGGGYVAGGWAAGAGEREFALVRYSAAGTHLGVTTASPGSGADEVRALAVQPDGRIVAVGTSGTIIGVARHGANGAAELAHTIDLAGMTGEEAGGVVVEPGGRILVAGTGIVAAERRFLLTGLTPDGFVDGSVGTDGFVTLDVGDGATAVHSLARQPDGKLLVAGATGSGGVLARFLPDGTPDLSFSTDGIARVPVPGAIVEDVALQPDGKVVAAGSAGADSMLARFRPGGAPDPGFGADGVVRRSLGAPGADRLTGVGIAPGGGIVAGGIAGTSVVLTRLVGGDSSDPALAMTAGSVGELVSFTLTATNPGADPATGVRVTVTPPAAVAAAALTTAGGACSGMTCSLGTLAPGAIRRMTLLARARTRGPLTASAQIAGATFDSNPGNNAASATGTAAANRARRDRIAPRLALRLRAKRIRQIRKRVKLVVRTSEAASVRVRVRARAGGRKPAKLAKTRTVKLRRAGSRTVRLRLTKAGRRAVERKRTRRLEVSVKARARDRAGNTRARTLRKTLRR